LKSDSVLFIDGKFERPCEGTEVSYFDTHNPSNGEIICRLPNASKKDVHRAVMAAKAASQGWGSLSGASRATFLLKIADAVKADSQRLAEIESLDCGKRLVESLVDMDDCVSCLRYNAQLAVELDAMQGKKLQLDANQFETKLRYEPFGVVALITPWNYPLLMAVQKVASAIASGNCCVLKPSEFASLTCIEFAEICRQCDLPKGVFNLLTGVGAITGNAMVVHPEVRKVSFTGSVPSGKAILKAASEFIKPVHLELGGKSPIIVFEDSNLKAVADWILTGIYSNCGQVCTATSRALIQKGIYNKLCDELKTAVENMKIGGGLDECHVGPVVCKQQYSKILQYLAIAKEENLTCLTGGGSASVSGKPGGYYIQPTVFCDVPENSRLWKEEIFGPVLCIRPFNTEADAIEEANNTEYGLAASVFSTDEDKCERLAHKLQAGIIWQNCSQPVFPQQPFGGFKHSGFGKENGLAGFMEYLQVKTITCCSPNFSLGTFITANS